MEDAVGLVDGLYPGAAKQGFRNFPESTTVKAPRISEVYTRGTLTLARLGREAPIAAASPAGPALRNARYGSLPPAGSTAATRPGRSPIIGTDSPVQYEERRCRPQHRLTTSGRRASRARSPSLREHEDARIIAGGHSLLPMMKLRLAHAVAPDRHQRPRRTSPTSARRATSCAIGALTRHVELLESELLRERFPVFRDAEEVIADPVVRNRGTIGGSLCQADAAEDLSAVCAALKAHGRRSAAPTATRTVPMSEFHLGP